MPVCDACDPQYERHHDCMDRNVANTDGSTHKTFEQHADLLTRFSRGVECLVVFPCSVSPRCNRGGIRYSVMAKIRYTANTSTPMNHAERPPLVIKEEVKVAMSIMTTAPGQ